ncbi:hypothetical protein AB1N83_004368 [Pleurotus pulmonarius]
MWIGRSSGRRGRPTESYPLLICNPATMVEAKQGCYGGHRVICLGLMFGATTVTAHHLRESRLLVKKYSAPFGNSSVMIIHAQYATSTEFACRQGSKGFGMVPAANVLQRFQRLRPSEID